MEPAALVARHGSTLTAVAEAAIRAQLETGESWLPDPEAYAVELREPAATFVTLEAGAELLGCIGTLDPVSAVVVDVARRARSAAVADPRFSPLDADGFAAMTVKVAVLSALTPVHAADRSELLAVLRPGVDGLVVSTNGQRATFLPSVWRKVSTPAEFVDLLWLKAGWRPAVWPRGLVLARYTTAEARSDPPRRPLARR